MGLVFSLSFYLNELVSGGLGINGDSISASWLRSFKSFVLEKRQYSAFDRQIHSQVTTVTMSYRNTL